MITVSNLSTTSRMITGSRISTTSRLVTSTMQGTSRCALFYFPQLVTGFRPIGAIRISFMERQRRKYKKGFPFKMTSVKRFEEYLGPCTKCQICFKTERSLERHEMMTHRKRTQNRHAQWNRKLVESGNRCVVKGERICSKFDKTEYMRRKASTSVVSNAGSLFVFESNLLRHLQIHHSEKQECAPCGESFSVKENGRCGTTKDTKYDKNRIDPKKPTKNTKGTRSVTTGSHECDQCDETFNLEPELKVHVEKTHRVRTDGESDGKFQTDKRTRFGCKI